MGVNPSLPWDALDTPNEAQINPCLAPQQQPADDLDLLDEKVPENRKLEIVLGEFKANFALVRTVISGRPDSKYESVCQIVRDHWCHEVAPEVQRV